MMPERTNYLKMTGLSAVRDLLLKIRARRPLAAAIR